MPTSNLGVPTLVAAQANKIVFINEAFEAFDQATQGVATYDAEDGDLTLTVEQFSAAYLLDFTGAPGVDRNITLPANVRRSFGVRNSTGRPLTLQLDSVTDSGVELADGAVAAFVSTTTELLRMTAAGDGGGAAITVEDEGTALATDAETLNFTGAGVTVTNDGTTASKKVINIPAATSGDGGLTAVETDSTLSGDGTSGSALGIAAGGVDTAQLADDGVTADKVENALLARVPGSALPAPSDTNDGKLVGLTASAYAAVDAPDGGSDLIIANDTTDLATAATKLRFRGAGVIAANDGTDAAIKDITIPGGSGGAALTVEDEGTALTTNATALNFTGAGVTVTNDDNDAGKKVIDIPAATGQGGGLTAVETDSTLSGDGTSGSALGIAAAGVDTTQLADDGVTADKLENALLARVPASALPAPSSSNNGKIVGLTATAYAAIDAPEVESLIVADETTDLTTVATRIQFQGDGVTAANDGTTAATKVVTIPGGGYTPSVSDKTAAYTIVDGDQGNTVRATGSAALTFTLPDVATPIAAGWWVRIANGSTAALTIDGNGADTIDGEATLEVAVGDVVTLQVVGATAWMVLTTTAGGDGGGGGQKVLYENSDALANPNNGVFRVFTLSEAPNEGAMLEFSVVPDSNSGGLQTVVFSAKSWLDLPAWDITDGQTSSSFSSGRYALSFMIDGNSNPPSASEVGLIVARKSDTELAVKTSGSVVIEKARIRTIG